MARVGTKNHLEPGKSRNGPGLRGAIPLHDEKAPLDALLEANGVRAHKGVEGEDKGEAGLGGQPLRPRQLFREREVAHPGLPVVAQQQVAAVHACAARGATVAWRGDGGGGNTAHHGVNVGGDGGEGVGGLVGGEGGHLPQGQLKQPLQLLQNIKYYGESHFGAI